MATGEAREKVAGFSGVLKKEVTNPRKDTPFVVLISLLTTLAIARPFVLLTGAANTTTETSSSIGRNLIIGGYHIHHFFYGFALICAAAWIAIQYPTRNLPRLAAALFGGGLGLCVDEMGYFLGGQVNYFERTSFFITLSIVLVLLSALSFRSFRQATREDMRWLVGRRPRGIAILAILQILASFALLVGGLVLLVAAGLPPSIDVQGEAAAFTRGIVLILLGVLGLIAAWGPLDAPAVGPEGGHPLRNRVPGDGRGLHRHGQLRKRGGPPHRPALDLVLDPARREGRLRPGGPLSPRYAGIQLRAARATRLRADSGVLAKFHELTGPRGTDDVFVYPGRPSSEGAGGSCRDCRKGDVRRDRLPRRREHGGRGPRGGPDRPCGAGADGRLAPGTRCEAV